MDYIIYMDPRVKCPRYNIMVERYNNWLLNQASGVSSLAQHERRLTVWDYRHALRAHFCIYT